MILVTGAGGHIGNVLVRLLYEMGFHDLRLMAHSSDTSVIEPFAKEIVRCDIRDAQAVENAVYGCTDVFHLAGYIHMTGSDKRKLNEINVDGVKNVVNACIRHGIRRLVYVSSIHALMSSHDLYINETVHADISQCADEYSRTKLKGTQYVMAACENRGLNAVTVFPTGVIGPYDYRSSMAGIMFEKYIRARGAELCFKGKFDFVDVRDVADGIYRAWKFGEKGQGYILSGESCSIGEMIHFIGHCAGNEIKTLNVPVFFVKAFAVVTPVYYRLAGRTPIITKDTVDIMVSGVSISNMKAKTKLGFRPRPLQSTLRDTVAWHIEEAAWHKERTNV